MTVGWSPNPTALRKVRAFVRRITPATAVPRMRVGGMRTTYAAISAATTPPSRSAPTTVQRTSAKLRAKKNPMLAHMAMMNSLVSTVPMTLRGSILPEESRVGVEMGPPPAASRVHEPGKETQRTQVLLADGTHNHRFLVSSERETSQNVNAEAEE